MKPTLKTSATAAAVAIACMAFTCSPAHAQAFSFGYAGPGVSVGVNAGNYGYFGPGGYYGGGYFGGYPVVAPGAFVAGPVAPAIVRPRVYLGGPVVMPRPYGVVRPYGRYIRPYPGYYRRGWW